MIYQFESGHAVPESSIGMLCPIFTITRDTELGVIAGPEALDAPEPSVFLETRVTVHVTWRLRPPGAQLLPPVVVGETPRRSRRAAAPAPAVDPDAVVGRHQVVVAQASSAFLQTTQFEQLAELEMHKGDDRDYQAMVHRKIVRINGYHERIRAQALETIPVDDPLSSPPIDFGAKLDEAVLGLRSMLAQIGVTGTEDVLDPAGEAAAVCTGLYELRDRLNALNVVLDPDVVDVLLEMPFINRISHETPNRSEEPSEDFENEVGAAA